MKKVISLVIIGILMSSTLSGCGASNTAANGTASKASSGSDIHIGVAMRRFDDTFLSDERKAIEDVAKGNAKLEMVDSQASQATQNDKVDLFITKKVNAIGVNLQDSQSGGGTIIDKCKAANIPVVFFNADPPLSDLQKWDKTYYVGAKASESGIMQGKIMLDYMKNHPEWDKNKDGVLQYVMLEGDPCNDAEYRTKYSIQTITEAGVKVEKLGDDIASWDRVKGQEKMAAFIAAHGDKIEAVFANNDDMALGAIEALKAVGSNKGDKSKYVPVIGVDATVPGQAALKDGSMLGTVFNDAKTQGEVTFKLLNILAKGETPSKDNLGYDITDGKYIWVAYKPITLQNISDIK